MKDRPKIAMIGQIGGGLFGNGVPVFLSLLKVLGQQFEVTFYSLMLVGNRREIKGLTINSISRRNLPLHFKYALLIARLIFRHIKNPFDVIYAVSAFPAGRMAILLGKILRRPVIIHLIVDEMVALPEISYGQLLDPKFRKVNKWVCAQASELIAISNYHKLTIQSNLDWEREIQVLPMGIETNHFPFSERVLSLPIQFVHVAYYHPVKDQLTLFQAFALIAKEVDCELTVVGEGFQNREVEKTLEELNIKEKVSFSGLIMNRELHSVFSKSHILLHSSLYETECVVALEAMASGVVVCSTAVGFLADEKEVAEVVPVANPQALAEAALRLVRDQSRYNFLRSNAKRMLDKYSAEYTGRKYGEVISRWVSDSSSK